jgi:arylsulfatase A
LGARHAKVEKYRNKPKPDHGVNNPVYAAMVEHVDDSVGAVLKKLEELGIAENTLVVFTSDNGGLYKRYDGGGEACTSNAPLRDEKGSLYEGGIRVPLIVRWPGKAKAGATCDEPTISMDFYPTFLAAAKADAPDQVLDGESLFPILADPDTSLAREAIYFHYPHYHHSRPGSVIRMGDWKLIEFFDQETPVLYNLAEDIGEMTDLAASQPERVKEMLANLAAWRKDVGAKLPVANPKYDPDRAREWWNFGNKKPLDAKALDRWAGTQKDPLAE